MKLEIDVTIVFEVDDEDGEELLETAVNLDLDEMNEKIRIHGIGNCQIRHEGVLITGKVVGTHSITNVQENELAG
jgi:hypothetical protein